MARIGIDFRMFSSKFTGIGRVNYELAKYLSEHGKEHTYVCFLNEPEYSSFPFTEPHMEKVLAQAPYYSLPEQTSFLKKLYTAKLDLMHFTHFNNPICYLGKQMVTIHDMTLHFFPGKKMTSPIHRIAYHATIWAATHKASAIIAVSENTKKDIIEQLHVDPKHITVCYEGVADHFTHPVSEEQKRATTEKYQLQKPFFLYTGVWREHKNVIGMIRAFGILVKEKGLDMDLVITGKKDPVYPEVENTITELGLTDRIHLTGLVDEADLHALYNLAQVYVFPSFYEGFGIPPLEALTAGLPVACSNTSCMPEICGPESVLYFNPRDQKDMANAMYRLATDKPFAQSLVKKGQEYIKKYSWNTMGKQTLDLYNSLTSCSYP